MNIDRIAIIDMTYNYAEQTFEQVTIDKIDGKLTLTLYGPLSYLETKISQLDDAHLKDKVTLTVDQAMAICEEGKALIRYRELERIIISRTTIMLLKMSDPEEPKSEVEMAFDCPTDTVTVTLSHRTRVNEAFKIMKMKMEYRKFADMIHVLEDEYHRSRIRKSIE